MSDLFYTKEPRILNPELAVAIGLNEAIIAQQIYWLTTSGRGIEKDGHRWVYKTYDDWQKTFPWWSTDTIKRTITRLEKEGLITTRTDLNKMSIDRTKWYRVNIEAFHSANPPDQQGILPQSAESGASGDPAQQGKLPSSNGAKCTDQQGNLPSSHWGNLPSPITKEIDNNTETNKEAADKSTADSLIKKSGKKPAPKQKVFASVENVLQELEPEILTYAEIVKTAEESKATVGTLSKFWSSAVKYYYLESLGNFLGITSKEGVQLRDAYKKLSGDHARRVQLIAQAVEEWGSFTEFVEMKFGGFKSPEYPLTWYILKYAQALEAWGANSSPGVAEQPATKVKGQGKVKMPQKFSNGGS